jgi:hypothetical protein
MEQNEENVVIAIADSSANFVTLGMPALDRLKAKSDDENQGGSEPSDTDLSSDELITDESPGEHDLHAASPTQGSERIGGVAYSYGVAVEHVDAAGNLSLCSFLSGARPF